MTVDLQTVNKESEFVDRNSLHAWRIDCTMRYPGHVGVRPE